MMTPVELPKYRLDSAAPAGDAEGAAKGETSAPPSVSRLAASLAHNVNNGLLGVIGYLELALRAAPAGEARDHLEGALRGSMLLAQRIRRITAFAARPEAAQARAAVSLSGLATDVACAVRQARPGVAVRLSADAGDCRVRANPGLLGVVLEQVVSGALEALSGGGTLTLRVWDEGSRRCLSVTDDGPGPDPAARKPLFEPFFSDKSLGLGPALCRDVLESQGGALHVAAAEGRGTTVTLSFPPPGASAGNAAPDPAAGTFPHADFGACWMI